MVGVIPLSSSAGIHCGLRRHFESSKLFPSHLICLSWQQRQLTLDKHYLHNARHTCDQNKDISSDFPLPSLLHCLIICEAVTCPLTWKCKWRSDDGTWSSDGAESGRVWKVSYGPCSWPEKKEQRYGCLLRVDFCWLCSYLSKISGLIQYL